MDYYFDEFEDAVHDETARDLGRRLAERFILEATCGSDPDDPSGWKTWVYDEDVDEWYEEP